MADTIDTKCPNCRTPLKLPAALAGKLIRCKKCEATFEVPSAHPAPAKPVAAKPAAARPAAPVAAAVPPPPPPADAPIGFKDDDDDTTNYTVVAEVGEDVPRCPFCAKELDPPDTKVCLNCGYDLVKRRRHESKTVVAAGFGDYAAHLGPGIACVIVVLVLLILDIVCFLNMRDWLTGSLLDAGEKDPITNKAKFYVPPYCFNLWLGIMTAFIMWGCGKFAYRRLVLDWRPPERLAKDRED